MKKLFKCLMFLTYVALCGCSNPKRSLMWICIILGIPSALFAFEPYRDGTSWIVTKIGEPRPGDTGLPQYKVSYTLVSVEGDGNSDYFGIQQKSDSFLEESFAGYIRREGENVYYKENGETEEWRLLYDFGLKPGETAVVYGFGRWETEMKCVEIKPDPANPGWEIMEMEEYYETIPGTTPQPAGRGQWIKGLSSTQGLIVNVFSFEGGGSRLEKVVNGDEVLWEAEVSAIDTVVKEGLAPRIWSEKGEIRVRDVEKGLPLKVISLDGKTVVSGDTVASSFVIPSLIPGTYIVTVGEIKEKVMVGE